MHDDHEFHFVYKDGVLKPDVRLDLPDGSRGVAQIREVDSIADKLARTRSLASIRRIGESGVFNSQGLKLTRDQMHERH